MTEPIHFFVSWAKQPAKLTFSVHFRDAYSHLLNSVCLIEMFPNSGRVVVMPHRFSSDLWVPYFHIAGFHTSRGDRGFLCRKSTARCLALSGRTWTWRPQWHEVPWAATDLFKKTTHAGVGKHAWRIDTEEYRYSVSQQDGGPKKVNYPKKVHSNENINIEPAFWTGEWVILGPDWP